MEFNGPNYTKLLQRQREAVKQLIGLATGITPVEIIYNPLGKPSLVGYEGFISISHSHDLVGICVSQTKTALDIERIDERLINIGPRFLNAMELAAINSASGTLSGLTATVLTTLYWCAKETLYKYADGDGYSFQQDLLVNEVVFDNRSSTLRGQLNCRLKMKRTEETCILQFEQMEEYLVVYYLNP